MHRIWLADSEKGEDLARVFEWTLVSPEKASGPTEERAPHPLQKQDVFPLMV